MKYVLGAKCVKCGREYPAAPGLTTCACGGILDIVYDYAASAGILVQNRKSSLLMNW